MAWSFAGGIFLTSMSCSVGLIPIQVLSFIEFIAPAVSCGGAALDLASAA